MPSATGVLLVALAYLALFGSAEVLRARWQVEAEATRRYVHMASGVIAVGVPVLVGWQLTAALGFIFAAALAWSKGHRVLQAIHGVGRATVGEVCFPLGVAATALLVPQLPAYAFGMLALAFGDGFAGLVGSRYGHPRAAWGGTKSLMGSLACFTVVVGLALAACLAYGPGLGPDTVAAVLVSALAVTMVEAMLGYGLDNLAVPVVAAALSVWCLSV